MSPVFRSIRPEKLTKFLKDNGFELKRIHGSHHIFFNKDTRKTTTVPFHKKDLPIGTVMSILRQSGFTKQDFLGEEQI